ncbi:class I SAM-dependent methyltransferase [Candidatus Uhrbacteria bacterium]|nr:class I SAM-dependent methyltransferase [Candidatus Uhrbacteria bacterium]
MVIPRTEMVIDPASYVDEQGRVFHWHGRVFRGVSARHASFVASLLEHPTVRGFQERGMLVEASMVREHAAEGFAFLLEHRKIACANYCFEWTPTMLQDAALLTLEMCAELSESDLTLQDAYPWNIFFDRSRPVFIDFGSIVPTRDDVLWAPYEQFANFFLLPLYLYSAGLFDLVRCRLSDYLNGVTYAQFFGAAPFALRLRYPMRYGKLAGSYHLANVVRRMGWEERVRTTMQSSLARVNVRDRRLHFFTALRREVAAIALHPSRSPWSSYYSPDTGSYRDDEFHRKEQIVREVLEACRPTTVLDAGCNTGAFAALAARSGCRVIAWDTDAASVERCYLEGKPHRRDVLPAVMDVLNPSPQFGWCGKQFPSAIERCRSEMVFAFALIHHLAVSQRQGFGRILDTLDALSSHWVLLEFVDADDPKVVSLRSRTTRDTSWYTFDGLSRVFAERGKRVTHFAPHSPTRRFVLYETQ